MAYTHDELKALIQDPKESLDTEIKRWIDPGSPEGTAKIAKGSIALYNNNGGCLIIGFTDSGAPDSDHVPDDVRTTFHADAIQQIVSKYASRPFEVKVEFAERDGIEYPIICVPSGVEVPVAAKSDLRDGTGKYLIKTDAVYVRSLNANHIVSSTEARAKDWERMTRICFDNREADIGAFIRRHLGSMEPGQLAGILAPQPARVTPTEAASVFLDTAKSRFSRLCSERSVTLPQIGLREASVVLVGEVPQFSADEDFLNRLQMQKPKHSGWSPWLDSRHTGNIQDRPFVFDHAWECLLVELQTNAVWGTHVDFWRMEPTGRFYHLRGLEDDLPHPGAQKPPPRAQLDFTLQVSRVAEIVSVGLSFARSMGCDDKATSLVLAMRWSGLRNRLLTSWADQACHFCSRDRSVQDTITTSVVVPLETPQSGISPFVDKAVAPLFALFGGTKFEPRVIEGIVNKALRRDFS
jgi:hypothetical protein